MEKQKKVIDASVVMKWFTKETNTDKAIAIKEEHVKGDILLISPDLIFIEVLNGLRYKNHSEQALISVSKELWNIELNIESFNETHLIKAIEIALKNNLTLYDALYVSIANFHGVPLITADKELYKLPNVLPLEKT
ncbi:MAG: type II toxin-antitoxin system VapC family toxin [Nanoarchaeota archaeon]